MELDKALEKRIMALAQKIYEERLENGIPGTSAGDWQKAYNMIVNHEETSSDPHTWAKK